MRRIIVLSMVSLDGVIQSPGSPKEDPSGHFKYGGWVAPFDDDVYDKVVQQELKERSDYILGRKTFEIWEAYWPHHGDFWPAINEGTKYVLSDTRKKSHWKNCEFFKGIAAIKKLKNSTGRDIQVWGSSELVHLLFKHDLVDELRLKIHPLILGRGKKLFDEQSIAAAFTLKESITTPSGVVICQYERAGKVRTGTIGS